MKTKEALHDEGWHAILEAKYSRVISEMSQMYYIPLSKAMDIFYASDTMQLMEDGVADLHCRSDKYLAEEVWEGYNIMNGQTGIIINE